jgi:hypothetical protein
MRCGGDSRHIINGLAHEIKKGGADAGERQRGERRRLKTEGPERAAGQCAQYTPV